MGTARRSFLFLQGPNGLFFHKLANELSALGHSVRAVHLCPADRWFWRREGGIDFRGRFEEWSLFLARQLRRYQVTDIILNGEQRPYHVAAIREAKRHGAAVFATDFGYLRTDWIAFEKDGMSGLSQFPKSPEAIRALAKEVPRCTFEKKFAGNFRDLARAEIEAAFVNTFGAFLFPHYRSHHPHPPIRCGFYTARRKLKAKFFGRRTKALIQRRIGFTKKRPFFFFPMQLEADAQLKAYSPFDDMSTVLHQVISSFAAHSRKEQRLMIKVHPLDPGVVNWATTVKRIAGSLGVGDRVDLVDVGLLDEIIRASAGIVTVNSTVGIIGLRFEKAVKTLGEAVYDIPGVTYQGSLDTFWTEAAAHTAPLRRSFLRALAGCLHVRGTYYSEPGVSAAARSAALRLHFDLVNEPVDPEDPVPGFLHAGEPDRIPGAAWEPVPARA